MKVSLADVFCNHWGRDAGFRKCYDFYHRSFMRCSPQQKDQLDQVAKLVCCGPQHRTGCLHPEDAHLPDDLPRPRLPKSLRQLYGNSEASEQRVMTYLHRVNQVDEFLLRHHTFMACDYCKAGWFGTNLRKEDMPGGIEAGAFLILHSDHRMCRFHEYLPSPSNMNLQLTPTLSQPPAHLC